MNAERLLEVYEQISEASDAIARLRRFVLDLAVRGKLVTQDAGDEPAARLVEKIVKQKLIETRSTGVSNIPSTNRVDEQDLFAIPNTWKWVPAVFPAVGISDQGKKVKTKDVLAEGRFPVVDQGKVRIRGFCDDAEKVIHVTQPLIIFGDHTRETKFVDFDFVVGADGVKILRPVGADPRFYHLALSWLPLDSRGYGRHFKLLKSSHVPLPPLAEQHRIVAKVDELMALCDRLEEARKTREEVRDKLTAASLARLTAPDMQASSGKAGTGFPSGSATIREDFPAHARFTLDALPALTKRPDQIKHLRQTILNLAVRGKLVKQENCDGAAKDFLNEIAKKKFELFEQRNIRRDRTLPEVAKDDAPFELPESWKWVRAQEISLKISDGVHKKPNYVASGVPFVTVKNLTEGPGISFRETKFISFEDHHEFIKRTHPERGDVLITKDGTIGVTRVIDTDREFSIFVSVALVKMVLAELAPFLALCLNSEAVQSQIVPKGAALKHLHLVDLRKLPLPLPPLASRRTTPHRGQGQRPHGPLRPDGGRANHHRRHPRTPPRSRAARGTAARSRTRGGRGMKTELIDSQWSDRLLSAAKASDGELRIISPFIKQDALKRRLDAKPGPISVITRYNLQDFAARVSDISALRNLLDRGAQIRGVRNLHSKLYLFGSQRAVVTSANLTWAGLNRNHEFGIDSTDESVISACRSYFDGLWGRTRTPLTFEMLEEWEKDVAQHRPKHPGRGDRGRLLDFGDDLGLPPSDFDPKTNAFVEAPQYFCKLQGMSSDRKLLEFPVIEEIRQTGCHWALAYPTTRRPRSVMDGAVMFISRFTKGLPDIRVFGRAFAFEHVPGRDEATDEDIADIDWKSGRRQYIRVDRAEFVNGTLENGVSLYDLMREMGAGIFASTERHKRSGHGNTDPFRAYMQQPQVELTLQGAAELNRRLQARFETHDLLPGEELEQLYRPKPIKGIDY